jgi:signal transduction histidine kinase
MRKWFSRLSVRRRLTLTYTGLFLVAGAVLLLINYEFMSQLPFGGPTVLQVVGSGSTGLAITPGDVSQIVNSVRDASLRQLLVQSIVALGIMAMVSALLGWYVSGRIVQPLREMTAMARRLSEHNLVERFNLQGPNDELMDLANTFDAMLARLDNAFQSQKNFVANASHELRTPLAITRAAIETQLERKSPTRDQWRDMSERVLSSTERSERLITSLLLLARVERGGQAREVVDLGHVVKEVLEEARPEAAKEKVELDARIELVTVTGDAALLRRMVANLIENAVRYNQPTGFVIVSLKPQDDRAQLAVMNSSAPLSLETLTEMFEPFRRGSDPRTRSSRGSGLGLSIVRSIAVAHGGTVGAESMDGIGVQVTVELPLHR